VEFDWLEDYKDWIKERAGKDYDYRLVSVHFLKVGDEYVNIDSNAETFERMIEEAGGVRKLIEIYYGEIRKAVETGWFDVVAHMDLIKIWNENGKYFSEDEEWYREEVVQTLEVIKKMGMKIDLNTKGFRRPCNMVHPSPWIIDEAKKMGIELLVGTDCHKARDLEAGLDEIEGMIE